MAGWFAGAVIAGLGTLGKRDAPVALGLGGATFGNGLGVDVGGWTGALTLIRVAVGVAGSMVGSAGWARTKSNASKLNPNAIAPARITNNPISQ